MTLTIGEIFSGAQYQRRLFVEAIRRSGGIITEDDSRDRPCGSDWPADWGGNLLLSGSKNATEIIRDGTHSDPGCSAGGMVYSGALGPVKNEPAMSL